MVRIDDWAKCGLSVSSSRNSAQRGNLGLLTPWSCGFFCLPCPVFYLVCYLELCGTLHRTRCLSSALPLLYLSNGMDIILAY